jgi:hypothetical protein
MRDLPKGFLDAASSEHDPDRRVLILLGARAVLPVHGNLTATRVPRF